MKLIQDQEVRERINFSAAIEAIETVLRARARGEFCSPARHYEGNDKGDLAFTIGGDRREGVYGFRVYPRYRDAGDDSQFTAVYDSESGQLSGLVFGDYLGAARTGAIGGVAIKHMAAKEASSLGVFGAGLQAETQVRAACSVRPIENIKVFSRSPEKCHAFSEKMAKLVNANIQPVASPELAIEGIDVLITATSSRTPVLDAFDTAGKLHINAVGPKFGGACELPADMFSAVQFYATDSTEQLADYKLSPDLTGAPAFSDCADLGALVSGSRKLNTAQSLTMFLSVGLAGTEPQIASMFL